MEEVSTTTTHCHFCQSEFLWEPGTTAEDGMYAEEVGEFWSDALQDSVLGHPDCLPRGIDDVVAGRDPEWKMA